MKKKILFGMTLAMVLTTTAAGNVTKSQAALHLRDKGDWCVPVGGTVTEWDYSFLDGKKFVDDNKVTLKVANPSILKEATVKKYGEKLKAFKGRKAGTTTVTARYKGKTTKFRVRVFSGFKMPQVKIKATSKKYQVTITNPGNSTLTIDKKKVLLDYNGENGGFDYGKVAGGGSVQIPAHATKTFCLVTEKGEYCNPDSCRVGVSFKGYKFTLSLPEKQGKATLVNPAWLDPKSF